MRRTPSCRLALDKLRQSFSKVRERISVLRDRRVVKKSLKAYYCEAAAFERAKTVVARSRGESRKTTHLTGNGAGEIKVWQLWFQEIEHLPRIVQVCTDSVGREFPGRILLNRHTISQYIDVPGFVYDRVRKGHMRICHFADIVRCMLLAKYGGLWIDATVFLSSDPRALLCDREFFAFRATPENLGGNKWRWIETWFMYVDRPSPLFESVADFLLKHWKHNHQIQHYFSFNHYLINVDSQVFESRYERILPYEQFHTSPHLAILNWHRKATATLADQLSSASQVHKLTYSLQTPWGISCDDMSVQAHLLRSGHFFDGK